MDRDRDSDWGWVVGVGDGDDRERPKGQKDRKAEYIRVWVVYMCDGVQTFLKYQQATPKERTAKWWCL